MKILPTTNEYVLEISDKVKSGIISHTTGFRLIEKFAKVVSQPLKFEMFYSPSDKSKVLFKGWKFIRIVGKDTFEIKPLKDNFWNNVWRFETDIKRNLSWLSECEYDGITYYRVEDLAGREITNNFLKLLKL